METMGTQESSNPNVEQARHLAEVARERAVQEADKRIGTLSEKLSSFASTLEHAFDEDSSSTERQIARQAAGFVRKVSERIEGKSTEELLSDARRQIGEHPAVVVASFAALGFLGGRLLKS